MSYILSVREGGTTLHIQKDPSPQGLGYGDPQMSDTEPRMKTTLSPVQREDAIHRTASMLFTQFLSTEKMARSLNPNAPIPQIDYAVEMRNCAQIAIQLFGETERELCYFDACGQLTHLPHHG